MQLPLSPQTETSVCSHRSDISRWTPAEGAPSDDAEWRTGLRMLTERIGSPIVLVDMDNTLVDWDQQFIRLMKRHHPHVPLVSDRTQFYIETNYPEEYRDRILQLTDLDGFWRDMDPVPGSVNALLEMLAHGMQVYILSTPDPKHTARCASEKLEWVEKHLGPAWRPKTILATDKTLVRGDILIDDRPGASTGLLKPSWSHLLFAQPYNRRRTDCPLLCSWNDWGPALYHTLRQRYLTRLTAHRLVAPAAREVEEAWDPLMPQVVGLCKQHTAECCGTARLGSPLPPAED